MTRINSNVNALIAQRMLGQNNKQLTQSLERLSTGVAVNRGADGPARLIASENLRVEQEAISSAISNAERADLVANIAEGGLQEISNLLIEVQGLIGESANEAGLSAEERDANQLEIDSILDTIDRIASTTSFGGTKLLNGSLDFQVSDVSSSVSDYSVNGAKIADSDGVDVNVTITASAQHAGLFVSAAAAALDLSAADASFVFELAGTQGSREFSFASGTTLTSIADSINAFTDSTGVSAAVSGTGLVLKSTGYGSDEFVSFDIVDDAGQTGSVYTLSAQDEDQVSATTTAFASITAPIRDAGQDVAGMINGVAAVGDGRSISVRSDALDVKLELTASGATATGTTTAMTITGGGATFNLGPSVDIGNQVSLGIGNVAARKLGGTLDDDGARQYLSALRSGGSANAVDGDLTLAQQIATKAVNDVSTLRGRIGAFQKNVVQSSITSLNVAFENTSAAVSAIRDTDFATETANMTRAQILVAASTNVTAIANSRPSSVLQLLG